VIFVWSSGHAMAQEPREGPVTHFSLPSSLAQLEPFRAGLRELLRHLGLPAPDVHDIVLATHEAVVNAMLHGNQSAETRLVEVEVQLSADRVVVQVADEGRGFAWREWLERGRRRATPADALTGRGILVMAAVMDDVTYEERGAVVRLTKRLAR
jgi:serine/threonine-protein kinase RsbW